MSYLLTEIALEMLGYKFYDTNGDFHLTNFQHSMTAVKSDLHSDEPSLMDFIHQTSNTESESSIICGQSKDTYEPSSLDPSTKSLISVDLRRAPARALAKMMKHESGKIFNDFTKRNSRKFSNSGTSEAISNMTAVPATKSRTSANALSNIRLRNHNYSRPNITTPGSIFAEKRNFKQRNISQTLLFSGKNKIIEDANGMKKFRLILEERLRRIDSRPYATYKRTFGLE
ncbi:LOW QUALITY PROTEIN: uncharacterized protein LOC117564394 [Drosophila albomicans]|uniref:LOW QUALITY PROTEIN: uncharacterized protein LOC117564394 n=1 Tax=Drosophila albomicans TaxID=7291 RepID=A0A9C6STH5_DROAB|nr:LOW QUALITY PROTEIN: uncharacterized protein LOC117564394 [Drosophila albomicans]